MTATEPKMWLLFVLVTSCVALEPRLLGKTSIPRAGFSNLYVHQDATDAEDRYSILLSCFNPVPFTKDQSYLLVNPGKYLDNLDAMPRIQLSEDFTWPREPSQTPYEVFGFESVTQPDGFLVPGKNAGSVNVVDMRNLENPQTYDIVPSERKNWFYHRVVWKDMNGDGLKDAMTCRARSTLTGFETEMIWLEQPSSGIFENKWKKHLLNSGIAGVFSVETELTAGGRAYDVIITAGYFTEKLSILWSNHPQGLWSDPAQIASRTIDVGGKFFDLQVADLNLDGTLDLLVSINAEKNGTLVAYEIPSDFRTGKYVYHLLADGFDAESGLNGGGSPGSANTFKPSLSHTGKPWIYASADDEGTAWYLTPASQSQSDWKYNKINILDEGPGNIVGKLTAADVNGDGYIELFIPSYIKGIMYAYSFAP